MLSKMASSKCYSEVSMVNLKLIIDLLHTPVVFWLPLFLYFSMCVRVCVLPGLGYKVE